MQLHEAISTCCAEVCIQVSLVHPVATKSIHVIPGKLSNQAITTWLVEDSHFFTLTKADEKTTLSYCHANKTLYYASPAVCLPQGFPCGHSLLVQCFFDQGNIPRVLAMDLVLPLIADTRARGETFRKICFNSLPPTVTIQWSGDHKALKDFLKQDLPHKVNGVLELTINPLKPTRELTIELPINPNLVSSIAELPPVPKPKKKRQKKMPQTQDNKQE